MESTEKSWVISLTEARPELAGKSFADSRAGVEIHRGSDGVADSAGPWLRSWEEVHTFIADVLRGAEDAFGPDLPPDVRRAAEFLCERAGVELKDTEVTFAQTGDDRLEVAIHPSPPTGAPARLVFSRVGVD